MIVTKGEIITEKQGVITTERLLTYSETEKQENAVNRSNANKLFTPEFVPCYLHELQVYKLSLTDAVIYGFIRFYLRHCGNTQFYFTNAQLSEMLNVSEKSITRGLQTLNDKGLVSLTNKVKAGGGTWRLVNLTSQTRQFDQSDGTKSLANKNKLNKNKLNKTIRLSTNSTISRKSKSFPQEHYNQVIEAYKTLKGLELKGREYDPVRQEIKTMFLSERTPAQIISMMKWLSATKEEWAQTWTLGTVKKKLPEFLAGKLKSKEEKQQDERVYRNIDGDKIHFTKIPELLKQGKIYYDKVSREYHKANKLLWRATAIRKGSQSSVGDVLASRGGGGITKSSNKL